MFIKAMKQNLFLLATFSLAAFAEPYGKYDLINKQNLPLCQKAVIDLHKGSIEKQDVLHKENSSYIQYELRNHEGVKQLVTQVICDLETGRIVDEELK